MSLGGGGGGGEEEEDLEEGDDEATAAVPKVSVVPASGVVDARYVVVGFARNRKWLMNSLQY